MKCPKCAYLGFDNGDRCRNCGYEFSLMAAGQSTTPLPASRRTPGSGQIGDPLAREPGLARGSRYRRTDGAGRERGVDRPLAGHTEGTPIDLPLFGDAGVPGALPPPRPPLQVRRATPVPGRFRTRSETPPPEALKLDLEAGPPPSTSATPAADATTDDHEASRATSSPPAAAPAGRRAAAAVIDVALAAAIDAGMLYFTLRLCDLTSNDLHALPLVPLVAFFLVLNGGYVILLTGTLGQTLGKMAAGIEVVTDRRGGMDIGRATLRTLAAALSLAPAGGGWLIGLIGERRALHDRLAGTRVIQISGS